MYCQKGTTNYSPFANLCWLIFEGSWHTVNAPWSQLQYVVLTEQSYNKLSEVKLTFHSSAGLKRNVDIALSIICCCFHPNSTQKVCYSWHLSKDKMYLNTVNRLYSRFGMTSFSWQVIYFDELTTKSIDGIALPASGGINKQRLHNHCSRSEQAALFQSKL